MERLTLDVGEKVMYKDKASIILKVLDLEEVTIEELDTNVIRTVPISTLSNVSLSKSRGSSNKPISLLTDKEMERANKRFELIKPILSDRKNFDLIKDIASTNGIHYTTIYRWLKIYDENQTISSLAGEKKTGGKGRSRLNSKQDSIINSTIEEYYLDSSKTSINKVIRKIKMACKEQQVSCPHENTIRNRINAWSEEELIRKRHGVSKARDKYAPIKDSFPGANHPLSVVQIDHTKLDIILVDEHFRQPFMRPWLTLAMDVYSRMVLGFYLSFDPPGELGTGLCIANSILPKESWLIKHDLKSKWPCWGIMKTIHLDNAKEFHGKMLKKACLNYGINIEYRPVKQPNWGGHIERLLGTFLKEIHDLPGTTFSDPKFRENYDSVKKAALTISDLEKWLLIFILEIYHKRKHSTIRMSPLQRYKEGILGNSVTLGIGQFPRILDERRLRLDFMPFVKRTVQEYGVLIEHIHYYDDVLRKHIHASEDNMKRKFVFRRDPRDISLVYFYDPDLDEYFEIPYRDTSRPPMSIWEFRAVLKKLEENNVIVDEDSIFRAYEEMEKIELTAIQNTKRLKRTSRYADKRNLIKEQKSSPSENIDEKINQEIKPFDDIDYDSFTS